MRKNCLIFIHLHRTGGTTLFRDIISPNIKGNVYHVYGYRRLPLNPTDNSFIRMHGAYGAHRLMPFYNVRYITMLREPLDRCVSYYYNLQSRPHPLQILARSMSLADFYKDAKYANMQTRCLAGFFYNRFYPVMRGKSFDEKMLSAVKRHLHEMFCFGIYERLCESGVNLNRKFGWNFVHTMKQHNKNLSQRPKVDELPGETLAALKLCNDLDLQLYEYACELFDARCAKVDFSSYVHI